MPARCVTKCAILADPRDPDKQQEIGAALDALVPELEKAGIQTLNLVQVPAEQIEPEPDLQVFIVLGGDGTMIHFAGKLNRFEIPFYGLNYGNVGFMMNNPGHGPAHHAAILSQGTYATRDFPLLCVNAFDLNGRVHKGSGLNDIYLQRMTAQSCRANVIINGTPLDINPILCDGLIVATPLGSTAYNFNTTGSLVAIDTPALTLTPIAAHRSCRVSCMMLPLDTRIEFEILEPRKRRVQVVSDGQSHGDLTQAIISLSPQKVKLCFDPRDSVDLPMRFINKAFG